MMGKLGLSLMN